MSIVTRAQATLPDQNVWFPAARPNTEAGELVVGALELPGCLSGKGAIT